MLRFCAAAIGSIGNRVARVILDGFPQALNENIVAPAALAVHGYLDVVVVEYRRERQAGELATLIRVENLGLAVTRERFLQGVDAEVRRQRIREPPGEELAARPVDDRHQVHKAPGHRQEGDVAGPRAFQGQ